LLTSGIVANAQSKLDVAIQFAEEGLALAKQIGDAQEHSIALNHLGGYFLDQGQIEKAKALWEADLALSFQHKNHEGIIFALSTLALLSIQTSSYDKAEPYLTQALPLALTNKSLYLISSVLVLYCELAYHQCDYPRALKIGGSLLATEHAITRHQQIEQIINDIRPKVPVEVYETAIEHGKALSVDRLAEQILENIAP
jgi:tetratricopeptide (TPR) repeat protein